MAGYVDHAGVRVVAGAPVSEPENLPEVVREFEREAQAEGRSVCYFAAESRFETYAEPRPEYSYLLLGAQPVWRPEVLLGCLSTKPSLRTQLHRAANKQVVVEEWPALRAQNDPELRSVLGEWLEHHGLPSLHFLVEPETLAHLEDRRIFVASQQGRVIGFVNISPIPLRNGWLVEQFVRATSAPNGTVELMLHAMTRTLVHERFDYVTLGLSPLTSFAGNQQPGTSPLIRALLYWARAHGKRFYNFEGLEFFKSKFEPEAWEPIYAVAREPRFSLRSLYAIACAFTNGRPVKAIVAGILKAIGDEFDVLHKKIGETQAANRYVRRVP